MNNKYLQAMVMITEFFWGGPTWNRFCSIKYGQSCINFNEDFGPLHIKTLTSIKINNKHSSVDGHLKKKKTITWFLSLSLSPSILKKKSINSHHVKNGSNLYFFNPMKFDLVISFTAALFSPPPNSHLTSLPPCFPYIISNQVLLILLLLCCSFYSYCHRLVRFLLFTNNVSLAIAY